MTVEETNNPALDTLFLKHINDFKGYTILINGKMPQNNFINKLMGLCSQQDIKFTLINDDTAKDEPNATGVLVVSKTAINHYRIEIDQVYAPEAPHEQLSEPKKKVSGIDYLEKGLKMKPLAYRMRPKNLDEVVGQEHLVGNKK